MKALCDMDTIQIELTNACKLSCSNCTRFCGHKKPTFISEDDFKQAVLSMVGFPKMTGFMGGEPLLHPQFEEFCLFAREHIHKSQLGLWTCLPKGFEKYAQVICDTFDHIFINDHSRSDIYHGPVLVASEEIFTERNELFYVANSCWLQNNWSASVNENGAFFCEIAASMSLLFDGMKGWPVEQGWWWKTPKDYTVQIEEYCPKCGCCVPLVRRPSTDNIDDISPGNYERLKDISLKIKNGKYAIHDLTMATPQQLEAQPMAAYKDFNFRAHIAARYGMALVVNEKGFITPYISDNIKLRDKSIFEEYKEKYSGRQAHV